MHFPVADIDVFPLIPAATAFLIAFICSTAGVTGAFLLLPFQISVLGFTGPSVTATNHFYNVFASPGGIIRFIKENRLFMPLAVILMSGTLPGIIIGVFIRIIYLPDPIKFKMFVSVILFILGVQLLWKTLRPKNSTVTKALDRNNMELKVLKFNIRQLSFRFDDCDYHISVPLVFFFSLIVGLVSGTYGIGGGSLNSAFLIGTIGLPVYTTAGATILTTFFASIVGTVGFTFLAPHFAAAGISTQPDWLLALFLGIGGITGTYLGAAFQKYMNATVIRLILALLLFAVAVKYGYQSLSGLVI
jgi:uncharacterized protein